MVKKKKKYGGFSIAGDTNDGARIMRPESVQIEAEEGFAC